MRVHALMEGSVSNGPGRSYVIWTQGCSQHCPGCCNPKTHRNDQGTSISPEILVFKIIDADVESVVLSGGEPLEQPRDTLKVLQGVKEERPELFRVLFTGCPPERVLRDFHPIFLLCDVVVAGPYDQNLKRSDGDLPLLASKNQRLMLPSGRVHVRDLENLAGAEVFIDIDGSIEVTGLDTPDVVNALTAP